MRGDRSALRRARSVFEPGASGRPRGRAVRLSGGIAISVAILFAAVALEPVIGTAQGAPATGETDVLATREGEPAADFTANSTDDMAITLSRFRGRPVWLVFSETWCQACRAEDPDIQVAFEPATQAGVVVIAVYLSQDEGGVADYARRTGLSFPIVADPDRTIGDAYRIVATPTHVFIDRSGAIRAMSVGGLDAKAMDIAWHALALDL